YAVGWGFRVRGRINSLPRATGSLDDLACRRLSPKDLALLLGVQACIGAIEGKKFFVRAGLDNPPVVDDKDTVGAFDGGQAVRNSNRGAPFSSGIKRMLYGAFIDGIERTGGFIENQDPWVFQEHACNCDALLLTTGKPVTALPNDRVIAGFKARDGLMDIRHARGLLNFFLARIRLAIA